MAKFNFKHLRYFWAVAREGGISGASAQLNVTPQTISGQLKILERDLGVNLFRKVGRNLVLTESGRQVLGYCEKMFQLEAELEMSLLNPSGAMRTAFRVGVLDVLPKLMVYQMLEPVLENSASLRLFCREGSLETLLAELAINNLDLVLADCPVPTNLRLDLFSHPLGECGTVFFGVKALADCLKEGFPASLTACVPARGVRSAGRGHGRR
ncbi:MAG: LysR family transcriptional regulator, partial [Alphaproteobacteria bacterium]|nr:LysR family transcriptional regulator [Alphaproteobacteria bacterium]